MPVVRFLATRDGETALSLPPVDLTPERTSLQGLREAFFERTGRHAFVLHDGGVGLEPEKDLYLVRLEGAVPIPMDAYPPLERARAWQQLGWFGKTLLWLESILGETVPTLEQVSTNDLACVLHVRTETRTVYLKASETGLEAALTAHLAACHPGLTPDVIAWDEYRLVTQDCGSRLSEHADVATWRVAVRKLAHFQGAADAQVFGSLGCPVHDFGTLADHAERFLQDADTLLSWGLNGTQTTLLRERIPHISRAHERVSALNLPLLPAHGDAHPMNALSGCGVVWFDLSEASAAHPLLDIGWFLAWLSHPARDTLPLRQTRPDAASELWSTYLRALDVPEAKPLLHDVMVLALTHRVLIYHA